MAPMQFATARVESAPENDRSDWTPQSLSRLAVSTLLEEAELTPKPALVDRRGNGAHHDLDLPKLRRSALALQDGFLAVAESGMSKQSLLRLREEIGQIGRVMERSMLEATDGSNAHRGAIWALGLLIAAAARSRSAKAAIAITNMAASIARLPDKFAPRRVSNGEQVRIRYGVAGARGEAQAGFPHAIGIGLPTLWAARQRGISEECARLDALMAIMARLEDTCLLHRGGVFALQTAQCGAQEVLDAGGSATPIGMIRLHRLDADLMALWASPGGSADLLSVALFLDQLESGSVRS